MNLREIKSLKRQKVDSDPGFEPIIPNFLRENDEPEPRRNEMSRMFGSPPPVFPEVSAHSSDMMSSGDHLLEDDSDEDDDALS